MEIAPAAVELDPPWSPRDTFTAFLEPADYRAAKVYERFLLTPRFKNAVLGESRGNVFTLEGCIGYFHHQEGNPASAFDNALALAKDRKRSAAILVDPANNRFVCPVVPELDNSIVRLPEHSPPFDTGATSLRNSNGGFIGDCRIEAVRTADGFVLLPYLEPRDILSGRIAFRSVGDDAAARAAQALSAAMLQPATTAAAGPVGFTAFVQFELDLGTQQSLPLAAGTRVDLVGRGASEQRRLLASAQTDATGSARLHVPDRNALGDAFGQVFFELTLAGSAAPGLPAGLRWSSERAMSVDGTCPGLLRDPPAACGTQQEPIRFRVRVPTARRKRSLPLDMAATRAVALVPFARASANGATCSMTWSFEYELKDAAAVEVLALCTGALRARLDASGALQLLLHADDGSAVVAEERPDVPTWFPACNLAVYASIDPDSVRDHLRAVLESSPARCDAIYAQNPNLAGQSTDALAIAFLSGEFALDVAAGEALARAARLETGRHRLQLSAKERADDEYSINLAYLAKEWARAGELDLSSAPEPLAEALTNATGPVIASGRVHSPAGAAELAALLATGARDGDWIRLQAGARYAVARALAITKPVVITADGTAASPGAVLSGHKPADADRGTPAWAGQAHRVFTVEHIERGLVQIGGVHFRDSADHEGGAISIVGCDRVLVEDSLFTGNEAFAGGWLYEGFGGAICTRHASICVRRCVFRDNRANCRGGAIGIFGYAWPIVSECHFEHNASRPLNVLNAVSGRPFRNRSDGGAIGAQTAVPTDEAAFGRIGMLVPAFEGKGSTLELLAMLAALVADGRISEADAGVLAALARGDIESFWSRSSIEEARRRRLVIRACTFLANEARDDGGGVYATGLARGLCTGVKLEGNRAGASGGALRISTACDFVVSDSQLVRNESNADLSGWVYSERDEDWVWTGEAGGGIAARTSNLRLFNVRVLNNRANRFAGGGIYFSSTDDGPLQGGAALKTNWNLVRDLLVRDFTSTENAAVPDYQRFSLQLSACTVAGNCTGWCRAPTETRPGPGPGPAGKKPPASLAAKDEEKAKGGGLYVLRYRDDDKGVTFPPIAVEIGQGTAFADNVAAFGPRARHLYIADFSAPAPNNPIRDTNDLALTVTGIASATFRYP